MGVCRMYSTCVTAGLLIAAGVCASGPGLPTETVSEDKVLKVMLQVTGDDISGRHNNIQFFDGWLVVMGDGGMGFVDVSSPEAMELETVIEMSLTEPYNMVFSNSYPGGKYAFIDYANGVKALDLQDIYNPVITDLAIPGMSLGGEEYKNRIEQLAFQPPYFFLPATDEGLIILDVTDFDNPRLAKHIEKDDLGGIPNSGYAYAVGNLLVLRPHNAPGVATYDISDPENPVLFAATTDCENSYGSALSGHILYTNPQEDHGVEKVDLSDPSTIVLGDTMIAASAGGGGYINLQDGYAHIGCSGHGYAKVDLNTMEKVAEITKGEFNAMCDHNHKDLDYASGFGQVAAVGDDDHDLTSIFLHQAGPDQTAPLVNMVNPGDGAAGQAVTSRVGITLTDQVDFLTVNDETFIVRKAGTDQPLAGKYSVTATMVNFCPEQDLEDDVTYEVVVPQGGIKDMAGNGVAEEFTSSFSTGGEVLVKPRHAARTQPAHLRPRCVVTPERSGACFGNAEVFDLQGRPLPRRGRVRRGVFVLNPRPTE